MFKILLALILLSIIIGFSINTVRKMTGKEKWQLTKLIGFSILCASLAFAAMISIVVIF
jgi:hypothetical protein